MEEDNDFSDSSTNVLKSLGTGVRKQDGEAPSVEYLGPEVVVNAVTLAVNYVRHVVIADKWPSWAFSLKALGSSKVGVYVSSASCLKFLSSHDEALVPAFDFVQKWMVTRDHSTINWPNPEVVWLQGAPDFVKLAKDIIRKDITSTQLPPLFVSITSNERKRATTALHGPVLSHKRVGGVTSSRWTIDLASLQDPVPAITDFRLYVERKLKHILKATTKGGIAVGTLAEQAMKGERNVKTGERTYGEDDRAPAGTTRVPVIAPSVFKRSGNVKRHLSVEELLELYDLQTTTQELVKKQINPALKEQDSLLLDIANSAPEKLTHHAARAILLSENVQALDHLNKQNDIGDSGDELLGGETDLEAIEWMHYEEEDADLNDEHAARDDDVKADIDQWDSYIVNNFEANMEWENLLRSSLVDQLRVKAGKRIQNTLICTGGEVTPNHTRLFELLRETLLRRAKSNVTRSFHRYLVTRYGKGWPKVVRKNNSVSQPENKAKALLQDLVAGRDAVRRFGSSTWWDWSAGSTLLFWRWHKDFQKRARDGIRTHRTDRLTPYRKVQHWPKAEGEYTQVKDKIMKVVKRGYISLGKVDSLTGFFAVPKRNSDIRLVYDATKCGLNHTIWAPSFWLPTIDTTLSQVPVGGFMADIDLGEMFLNFPLDHQLWKDAGIDVTELREQLIKDTDLPIPAEGRVLMHWNRCLMGLRSSPFQAVSAFAWAEDFIRGLPGEMTSPLRYDKVITNYPGSAGYDPSKPRVIKWRDDLESFASNFEVYIDDIRVCGENERECVQVSRRVASRSNYLGIQDAPRKRRFPSRNPGVWSGAKSISSKKGLYTSTTQEKWCKGKGLVLGWLTAVKGDGKLVRKELEKGRGFLVHLARTYPIISPYLKGLHHTLESWRVGRDKNGWKWNASQWKVFLEEAGEWESLRESWTEAKRRFTNSSNRQAPDQVDGKKVRHFLSDLMELELIFDHDKPPRRLVRGTQVLVVQYGFGDASGGGFGSTWETTEGIMYRCGVWGRDNCGKSSNYRELKNLVDTIDEIGQRNGLAGVELYFFTDNSTAEKAYYKGTSTSELLHNLISRLKRFQMSYGCRIILTHVAGTRMIAQGSDGLSRGNMSEGVMMGKSIQEFVPLHLSPVTRSPKLVNWIKSWTGLDRKDSAQLEVLSEEDWYFRGHDMCLGEETNYDGIPVVTYKSGVYLWHPAPAGALTALEQIRKARSKRVTSTHIFICPKLMEPEWRGQVYKSADVSTEVPAGEEFWGKEMHESLILAIYFPYLTHRPWELRKNPSMHGGG